MNLDFACTEVSQSIKRKDLGGWVDPNSVSKKVQTYSERIERWVDGVQKILSLKESRNLDAKLDKPLFNRCQSRQSR